MSTARSALRQACKELGWDYSSRVIDTGLIRIAAEIGPECVLLKYPATGLAILVTAIPAALLTAETVAEVVESMRERRWTAGGDQWPR